MARALQNHEPAPSPLVWDCTGAGSRQVAVGAHKPGAQGRCLPGPWPRSAEACALSPVIMAWATSSTHASGGKVTLAVGVMNGRTVMKWRHQGGWREDGVWRTGRPHAAATRRIAQRPGAVKGEITHLLCLFLTATAPIHHHWGRGGTRRPISSMNYGTEKH